MGESDTELDLDTLTSMLDSDEETTGKMEKKEISSNDNDILPLENEEFGMDEDLNTLANLMEDDDDMHSSVVETNKTSDTRKPEDSANLSAADLGLELSDDDEEKETNKNSGKSSFGTAFADSKFAPKYITPKGNDVDPLEKELQEMEARMRALKDQLKKKKRIDSPGSSKSNSSFTKLTNVVDSPKQSVRTLTDYESSLLYSDLQRGSEIHKGDTDSEDEEDNSNPFEQNYTSFGRDIKKRITHDEHKAKITAIDKNSAILDRVKKMKDIISFKKEKDSNSTTPMPVPNLNSGWKKVDGSLVGLKSQTNSLSTNNYQDASCDPYSGIRISNPLISADAMRERMDSRKMVRMSTITLHLRGGEIEGDWVTIGVVVDKSAVKTSQKGTQYSIWTLSDLKDCTKTVSLFLFAGAHKDLWKTSVGSVIGLLNPDIMKDREGHSKSKDLITLSVNYQQKVMMMGSSKDLGWCKGTNRQQGSKCRNFVDKSSCEFCVYHIQAEYKKTTAKRSDLQSSFSGVVPKQSLQQKILGKGEVFYGGQSFSAAGSEPSMPKMPRANRAKDNALLGSLKTKIKADELKEEDRKKLFVLKHMSDGELQAVRELSAKNDSFTERLLAPTPGARNLIQHKNKEEIKKKEETGEIKVISAKELLKMTHQTVLKEKKQKASDRLLASPASRPKLSSFTPRSDGPQLGRGLQPGKDFDLDFSFSPPTKGDMAKARAVALLKGKGGIQATSPNAVRNKNKSSDPKFQESVRKRVLDTSMENEDGNDQPSKRSRLAELSSGGDDSPSGSPRPKLGKIDVNSEKYKAMMQKTSKHTNLITAVEDEAMDKYYNNLEKKEMLEDKMKSIMEISVNAVACLKCKYLAESVSDLCKSEGHPTKVVKTKKRFFQCKNCKRRTSSLDKLPRKACSGCEGTSWERCGMGRERKGPKLDSEILSLRGNELKNYAGTADKVYLHI